MGSNAGEYHLPTIIIYNYMIVVYYHYYLVLVDG